MANNNKLKNEDILIKTISDFKQTADGQMIDIHGKDYATVAHRLAIFRRNLGARARIETFILDRDKETVAVKAIVSIDNQIIATGMAEEKRTSSRINQTSALENCETSAVGRALAMCGITNDKIASAEEVAAAIEQQDIKIQSAITALKAVSHSGNYQEWLTNHKTFLADLKNKNPISYKKFVEQFNETKNQLKTKGIKI